MLPSVHKWQLCLTSVGSDLFTHPRYSHLLKALLCWQMEADVADVKEELAQTLFDHIPVGVGSQGIISTSAKDLEAALEMGMDWSLREVCSLSSC